MVRPILHEPGRVVLVFVFWGLKNNATFYLAFESGQALKLKGSTPVFVVPERRYPPAHP